MQLYFETLTFAKLRCLLKLEYFDFVYIFIEYFDFVSHIWLIPINEHFIDNFRNQMKYFRSIQLLLNSLWHVTSQ